ncbi:hypothetical protein [Rathayibacter sp. VKM Ac-2928]|uniref:hypothetical protein n=1 Tax=Rathayibacter sp. VKM Ac-2928 TaxID=2929479 RepID=UPI001FB3FE7C|nr:hypothetical protein [Rathayibacter sp. VKM Ac-2928]MCJ1685388.1 hypothetical protein [Rathayibacter sp. VKM Ac-2928]
MDVRILRLPTLETDDEHDRHGVAMSSLKKDDSYNFSYDFEYIEKNHGQDNYDIGIATMNVDVVWSDAEEGYIISFDSPDVHKIDPAEGNSDLDGFWNYDVETRALSDLAGYGIHADAIVI